LDKLAFLDGDSPAEPAAVVDNAEIAPAADPAPETAADSDKGPARGPDGKFVAKADGEAAPAAEPAPAAPAEPAPEPEPAVAEPDETTRLREQVAALNKALTQERAQRRQMSHAPDPEADPAGFEAYRERESALTFEWSFKALAATHGADKAREVAEWARDLSQEDPSFYERALSSPDPAGFAFAEYRRDQVMQRMMDPDFFAKFEALNAAPANPNPAPAVTVAPPSPPSPPPRSLATAPSAGSAKPGAIPTGPGVAFDTVFKD